MLVSPTFNIMLGSEIAGDDPLGLAPVNERLYGAVFPGINNVVQFIRVYSALCWTVRCVDRNLQQAGAGLTQQEANEASERALEKIQLLLTFTNQPFGILGLAGARRRLPNDNQEFEAVFASFPESDAAYMDPVQYNPSLTNGLGFLEIRRRRTYGCTPAGEALAEAFETQARDHPLFEWLADVTLYRTRRDKVLSLQPILDLRQPSLAEQEAFLASYFPLALRPDADVLTANRQRSLTLTLRAIHAVDLATGGAGADEEAIRLCMARGFAPDGRAIFMTDVGAPQAWWSVLQLRQYQRLALEMLWCAVEHWLQYAGARGEPQSVRGAAQAVAQSGYLGIESDRRASVQQLMNWFAHTQGAVTTLYEASLKEPALDLLQLRRALQGASLTPDATGVVTAVSLAYFALTYSGIEARNLEHNALTHEALKADFDKSSLWDLARLVQDYAARSPKDLLVDIVENQVILRHFDVVTRRSRSADGKNRFRFLVGDNGLQRYDSSLGLPRTDEAADRLAHALMLLEQAGLLGNVQDNYRLTERGQEWLAAVQFESRSLPVAA